MTTCMPPLRPPRADALFRTIERWIDASIHAALSSAALTQRQHMRAQVLLQRWRQRVMVGAAPAQHTAAAAIAPEAEVLISALEVSAISDERGLIDLLSQIDQLTARTSGLIDSKTPLLSASPPADQLCDELMAACSEEKERLTAVAEELEVRNKLLQADASDKRQLLEEYQRDIRATVELMSQAKQLTLGLGDVQGSDE